MSFFSSKGNQSVQTGDSKILSQKTVRSGGHEPIPQEILSAVRLMGDAKSAGVVTPSKPVRTEQPQNSLASSVASPFLISQSTGAAPSDTGAVKTEKLAETPSRSEKIGSGEFNAPVAASFTPEAPVEKKENVTLNNTISAGIPAQGNAGGKTPGSLLVYGVVGLIAVLFAAGGGYYYWQNQKSLEQTSIETLNPPLAPDMPPTSDTPPAPVPLQTLPYALDKPNYLSVDTEALDAAGMKMQIDEVANRLVAGSIEEPIEFIVTDKNNNPLAFSRFAYLMNLTLPGSLLAEVNEVFSLYISSEAGRAVLGLSLSLKDVAKASTAITENEAALPKGFQPLLYPADVVIPETVAFTPSASKSETRIVRYHNFSLEPNISFDYTVSGNRWHIGTTQNMFRAMLERAEQP